MNLTDLYLNKKTNKKPMDKIYIAKQITEDLDLPSVTKRMFIEDIEEGAYLDYTCGLTSLVHDELLLSTSKEDLKNRLEDKQEILQNIINNL